MEILDAKNWFAIYTRPRYEKKAAKLLSDKNIEIYLPLVKSLRQWSDRKKWVEAPMFTSYLFVYCTDEDRFEVLNTIGVVRFISFEGKAVAIPTQQIENIKWILSTDVPSKTINEILEPGNKVEVVKGPLRGLEAEMVSYNNKSRIIIRMDQLNSSVEIQIPAGHVVKCD